MKADRWGSHVEVPRPLHIPLTNLFMHGMAWVYIAKKRDLFGAVRCWLYLPHTIYAPQTDTKTC